MRTQSLCRSQPGEPDSWEELKRGGGPEVFRPPQLKESLSLSPEPLSQRFPSLPWDPKPMRQTPEPGSWGPSPVLLSVWDVPGQGSPPSALGTPEPHLTPLPSPPTPTSFFFFNFWPHFVAGRILVPQPGIESMSLHWKGVSFFS